MTRLFICGEAWGVEEEAAGRPFVGSSGRLLSGLLRQSGIDRQECYITNVFNLRPRPTNDVLNLCGPKVDGIKYMKPLAPGKYVRAEYKPEVDRLWREVQEVNPNLILALGNTAIWALCRGAAKIGKMRGSVIPSHLKVGDRPVKVLPTYHPAAVMREWSYRPIVLADLAKAKREMEFPDIRRPRRQVWIEPTLDDLSTFERLHLQGCKQLSIDIETKGDQITCVGFAPSSSVAIVIPFYSVAKEDGNYWPTLADERQAWNYVRRWCSWPAPIIVGQNVLYDVHFLYRKMGIALRATDDTMLLHHALQPEMEKGLGFLGSIYTDELSWKSMRKSSDTLKKEDE